MITRAHPRVRGDVSENPWRRHLQKGSPPRARGRRAAARVTCGVRGLTPACAGTSRSRFTRCCRRLGSPPRARGRPFGAVVGLRRNGLTPACAGTSAAAEHGLAVFGAHPRVRGDVVSPIRAAYCSQGSPPRARGRPKRFRWSCCLRGLTPACAGTSDLLRRGCGDEPGSPPRARGRRRARLARTHVRGLTPACAGTSVRRAERHPRHGAHPRVRGDVVGVSVIAWFLSGSPPRARGRLHLVDASLGGLGLTPACAGTSSTSGHWRSARRAHPRVRGDVRRGVRVVVDESGLTPARAGTSDLATGAGQADRAHPRVRGDVRLQRRQDRRHLGLTPACAGTSSRPSRPRWRGRAHPRVRGDVRQAATRSSPAGGSPPRARGRRV